MTRSCTRRNLWRRPVVVGSRAGDRPQQAQRRFRPVTLELGSVAAVGAVDAGSLGAELFFKRPSRAAAPIRWTILRVSNSVSPKTAASDGQTNKRARARRSAS